MAVRPRYRTSRNYTIQRRGRKLHDDISGMITYEYDLVYQTNPITGEVTRVNYRNRGTFDELYGTGPEYRPESGVD